MHTAACADCGTVCRAEDLLRGPFGAAGADAGYCLDCLIELARGWFLGKARLRWQFLHDFATVSV